jgi:hypothetical protein
MLIGKVFLYFQKNVHGSTRLCCYYNFKFYEAVIADGFWCDDTLAVLFYRLCLWGGEWSKIPRCDDFWNFWFDDDDNDVRFSFLTFKMSLVFIMLHVQNANHSGPQDVHS